jgi:hypothetical protein
MQIRLRPGHVNVMFHGLLLTIARTPIGALAEDGARPDGIGTADRRSSPG